VSAATGHRPSRARFPPRLASAADDEGTSALCWRDTPMTGSMQVTFEREPDFLVVRHFVAASTRLVLERPRIGRQIVGLATRSIADAFVNGRSVPFCG